jgi:wyosine [tRNA(Phe)-imidazoG37] synthetase (radical SAM superfamily)
MTQSTATNLPTSTVYGPVQSWRVGKSLGVDVLFVNSICSFRCIYCQLGKINEHTAARQVYVPTARIMADLKASAWQQADVITLSGSGEPTLAANLGEVIHEIKAFTGKPVVVLTNAIHLDDPAVRRDLREADKVFCKLDAADDETLRLIDRPVAGITVRGIVEGIKAFKREYPGYLGIQIMLMPLNAQKLERFADLLKEIGPDEVQLNTPLRPVPRGWFIEARGSHDSTPYPAAKLKVIDREEAARIEAELRQLTGLNIVSVYRPQ